MKNKNILNSITLDPNEYYILSPCGLGDTMILCGYKKALEKRYNAKINFIIKPSHEIILKMYNIESYIIDKFSHEDLIKISEPLNYPQKGSIFIAHPIFHNDKKIMKDFLNAKFDFLTFYKYLLGLSSNSEVESPSYYPEISEETKQKLEGIAPLEKIAIIAPEANSVEEIPLDYYVEITKKLKNEGFQVISNVINESNKIPGTIFLPLSLEDGIALAIKCARVYSIMSGFCNLIFEKTKNLTILYPNNHSWDLYSIKKTFNNNTINEEIYNKPNIQKIYLFNLLLILSIEKIVNDNDEKIKYYLFGFLEFFRIKIKHNTRKYYLLGLPILKIKKD